MGIRYERSRIAQKLKFKMTKKEFLYNNLPFIEDAKLEQELIRYLMQLNLREPQLKKLSDLFTRVRYDGVYQGKEIVDSLEDMLELVQFKFTPKQYAKTPQEVIEKAKKNMLLFKKI